MKTISLLTLSFILVATGCTRVGVREPIGTPVLADEAPLLSGTWLDSESKKWQVDYLAEKNVYTVVHDKEGERVTDTVRLRSIGDQVFILWFEDEEIGAHIPLRILPAIGEEVTLLTLLFADDDEVERLLDSGAIQGKRHESEDAWVLEGDGLHEHLAGKDFWRLDASMPLLKED